MGLELLLLSQGVNRDELFSNRDHPVESNGKVTLKSVLQKHLIKH